MNEFNKGDVVRLKSGGPDMTVSETNDVDGFGHPMTRCVWFQVTAQIETEDSVDALFAREVCSDLFVPETLEKVAK